MGVYESQEKMVVSAPDLCSIIDWNITCTGRKFGNCTIYLYLILNLMNREKHLETILVLVLALGVFFWLTDKTYLLLAAGILAFIGIFIPFLADKIHWAWMKLAHLMGYVMSKVLLTLIYVVVLLPLSFLSRTFGNKNGIRLKPGAQSYFKDRNFTYTKENLENVW